MKILWLASVENDLIALCDYIAEDKPSTGLRIFGVMRQSVEKLKLFPLIGREGRVEKTRELVIPNLPFIIVYFVTKDIKTIAVLHTSIKWPDKI